MIALLSVVAHAVTHTVTTASDVVNPLDGVLSLREALVAAGTGDLIVFGTTAFPVGTQTTILLTGTLEVVVNGVIINGNGRVILDGSSAPPGTTGLEVDAIGVQLRALEIKNMPAYGVWVVAGANHRIGAAGAGLTIHNCGESGIRIGDAFAINGAIVRDTIVSYTCASPAGACAGIELRGAAGSSQNQVLNAKVTHTLGNPNNSQGIGIYVGVGTGHVLEGNTVSDNASHGIAAMGAGPVTALLDGVMGWPT